MNAVSFIAWWAPDMPQPDLPESLLMLRDMVEAGVEIDPDDMTEAERAEVEAALQRMRAMGINV